MTAHELAELHRLMGMYKQAYGPPGCVTQQMVRNSLSDYVEQRRRETRQALRIVEHKGRLRLVE